MTYYVYAKSQNRTALGIVSAYLLKSPSATLSDLQRAFPDSLNPDSGVGVNFVIADEGYRASQAWQGYFNKEEELLNLQDGSKVALVSMWTRYSLRRLIEAANALGIIARPASNITGILAQPGITKLGAGFVIALNELDLQTVERSAKREINVGDLSHPQYVEDGSLLSEVVKDIHEFFSFPDKSIYCNENDFQMHLAMHLQKKDYDDVDVEYYLPDTFIRSLHSDHQELIKIYPWISEKKKISVYLDIVVRRGDEYLPIELKYNTTRVDGEMDVLGVRMENIEILRHQGALDFFQYNFWKDVKRVEAIKKRASESIKNGIVLCLTNNTKNLTPVNEGTLGQNFCMANSKLHGQHKYWMGESRAEGYLGKVPFEVEKEYRTDWIFTEYHPDGVPERKLPFYYCMVII